MEKQILINFINENKSIQEIAFELNKSKTTIRYWLSKYELKTNYINLKCNPTNMTKICPKCKLEKDLTLFHNRRNKKGNSTYCKSCTTSQTINRQQTFKIKCLEYKGNSCLVCNYNKYYGALEFHHLDPNEKDFSIGSVKLYQFNDNIKKELDKCVVLCSNCHKEVHANLINLNLYINQ